MGGYHKKSSLIRALRDSALSRIFCFPYRGFFEKCTGITPIPFRREGPLHLALTKRARHNPAEPAEMRVGWTFPCRVPVPSALHVLPARSLERILFALVWEIQAEGRAFSRHAFRFNETAVFLHDLSRNRQSESRAAASYLRRKERFEDQRQFVRIDSRSRIGHFYIDEGRIPHFFIPVRSSNVPPFCIASAALVIRLPRA